MDGHYAYRIRSGDERRDKGEQANKAVSQTVALHDVTVAVAVHGPWGCVMTRIHQVPMPPSASARSHRKRCPYLDPGPQALPLHQHRHPQCARPPCHPERCLGEPAVKEHQCSVIQHKVQAVVRDLRGRELGAGRVDAGAGATWGRRKEGGGG